MGNDGGDIPGRKELVREKQKVQPPSAESIAMGRYIFLHSEPDSAPLQTIIWKSLWQYVD